MFSTNRSIRWLFVLTLSIVTLLISLALIGTASAQGTGPQSPQAATGGGFTINNTPQRAQRSGKSFFECFAPFAVFKYL